MRYGKDAYVVNAIGEKEPFSFNKVYWSARRAGAPPKLSHKAAEIVQKQFYPGIKTSEIFSKIRNILSQNESAWSIKFSLKEGMRKLGPTGFPFEKYIGEIFIRNNFEVKLNQHLPGLCCKWYEIDFLARKENLIYVGECKYHNLSEGRVHSNVALSNYARFLDIKAGRFFKKSNFRGVEIRSLLVTNTKFTTKAIRYSNCVGVDLIGWKYPRGKNGLEYLIDNQGLYPITILPSLSKSLAEVFVARKKMMVKDVFDLDIENFVKNNKKLITDLNRVKKEAKILLEM